MMESSKSKRRKTKLTPVGPHAEDLGESSVQPEPVFLHPADCKESALDLQRMRDLIEKDPSLLFRVQPMRTAFGGEPRPPLWHSCSARHPNCVKLILQASGPNNIKRLDSFRLSWQKQFNILSQVVIMGKDKEKNIEIMKALLEFGFSPNLEIGASEICNSRITKILKQYKTKTVIFPSRALHTAVEDGYSRIIELLFEHGAYADPVILTESGSILPLYPTLGKHLNPIPGIMHRDLADDEHKLLDKGVHYSYITHGSVKHVECIKILLVNGASLPPYTRNGYSGPIFLQELFPFDAIAKVCEKWKLWNENRNPYVDTGDEDDTMTYPEMILSMLKLYHQFGGSLWWKMKSKGVPCKGEKGECVEWLRDPERVTPCKTIIDVLEECIPDPDAQGTVVEEVQRMMSTPPSLQHSARLAIRRAMGYGCVRNLEALPLPDRLNKYLKFETE